MPFIDIGKFSRDKVISLTNTENKVINVTMAINETLQMFNIKYKTLNVALKIHILT